MPCRILKLIIMGCRRSCVSLRKSRNCASRCGDSCVSMQKLAESTRTPSQNCFKISYSSRVSCRPVLGGETPPQNQLLPPKFVLTLFLFTLSPLPLGYSPPKVLQLPPKGEILQETLSSYFLVKYCAHGTSDMLMVMYAVFLFHITRFSPRISIHRSATPPDGPVRWFDTLICPPCFWPIPR